MYEVLSSFVNEFYVFALSALGMVLAYFGKLKDNQDNKK